MPKAHQPVLFLATKSPDEDYNKKNNAFREAYLHHPQMPQSISSGYCVRFPVRRYTTGGKVPRSGVKSTALFRFPPFPGICLQRREKVTFFNVTLPPYCTTDYQIRGFNLSKDESLKLKILISSPRAAGFHLRSRFHFSSKSKEADSTLQGRLTRRLHCRAERHIIFNFQLSPFTLVTAQKCSPCVRCLASEARGGEARGGERSEAPAPHLSGEARTLRGRYFAAAAKPALPLHRSTRGRAKRSLCSEAQRGRFLRCCETNTQEPSTCALNCKEKGAHGDGSCVSAARQHKNRPHVLRVLYYHKIELLSTVNVVSCKIKNPVVNS